MTEHFQIGKTIVFSTLNGAEDIVYIGRDQGMSRDMIVTIDRRGNHHAYHLRESGLLMYLADMTLMWDMSEYEVR